MLYLIIDPVANGNTGLATYAKSVSQSLGINSSYLKNSANLPHRVFQKVVRKTIMEQYGSDEVIIESPEARASALLLPKSYKLHVRLHTPLRISSAHERGASELSLNENPVFVEEDLILQHATALSAPSYAIANQLKASLNRQPLFVYKNPPDTQLHKYITEDKIFDAVFMGRFQRLKGTSYINPILERLPRNYCVGLIGPGSESFPISSNVKCNVNVFGGLNDDSRFDIIARSKKLMMLSRFENCSMVILETLSCGTVVCAWDVGGNTEIAPPPLLETAPLGDIAGMAELLLDSSHSEYPKPEAFTEHCSKLLDDFNTGFMSLYNYISDSGLDHSSKPVYFYQGLSSLSAHKKEESLRKVNNAYSSTGKKERVFGFTVSNEHIQEMWAPLFLKFGVDYQVVCPRPLNFMFKFNNPYPVDKNRFIQFSWPDQYDRLLLEIHKFKPNKILTHNGDHPKTKHIIDILRFVFDVPVIFTELGWLPQNGNVYIDPIGTNASSSLAAMSVSQFCGEPIPLDNASGKVQGKHTLILTQLENDTNMILHSPRIKKVANMVQYVLDSLPEGEKIIIKTHPLDQKKRQLERFSSERVQVVHDADLDELMASAKAVVANNSTAMIQALKYDCNIYALGFGILNNKGVVIDCTQRDLRSSWTEEMAGSRSLRDAVLRGFEKRQITLKSLGWMSEEDISHHLGLESWFASSAEYLLDDATFKERRAKAIELFKELSPVSSERIIPLSSLQAKIAEIDEITPEFIRHIVIDTSRIEPSMIANKKTLVMLEIENSNDAALGATTKQYPLYLSYHWVKEGEVVIHNGLRSRLHFNVIGSVEHEAVVQAPEEEGIYTLQWDLVIEGHMWFGLDSSLEIEIQKD